MKATKDTRVGHGLAAWSPGGRLGYYRCLVHQDIFVGGVQGGENLEPGLGCAGSYPSVWGAGYPGYLGRE
ncbi:unnamed protein product [Prunus armeniaca]